jgi:hypothetical protein
MGPFLTCGKGAFVLGGLAGAAAGDGAFCWRVNSEILSLRLSTLSGSPDRENNVGRGGGVIGATGMLLDAKGLDDIGRVCPDCDPLNSGDEMGDDVGAR